MYLCRMFSKHMDITNMPRNNKRNFGPGGIQPLSLVPNLGPGGIQPISPGPFGPGGIQPTQVLPGPGFLSPCPANHHLSIKCKQNLLQQSTNTPFVSMPIERGANKFRSTVRKQLF